jgi:hypothetical protein
LKDLKKKLIKRRGAAWRGAARGSDSNAITVSGESFKNVFITFLLYGANWP